jgi:hypothetical protein
MISHLTKIICYIFVENDFQIGGSKGICEVKDKILVEFMNKTLFFEN